VDFFYYSIIFVALFLGFAAQTVTGFAAGLVALPVLIFVIPLSEAVALVSVYLFIFSIALVPAEIKRADKPLIRRIFLPLTAGLVIGILVLKVVNESLLSILLALFIFAYLFFQIYRKKAGQPGKAGKHWAIPLATTGGIFSGAFASGGPLFVIYLQSYLSDRSMFRATVMCVALIPNVLRLVLLVLTGVYSPDLLLLVLYSLPAFILAIGFGKWLLSHISVTTFERVVYLFLAASAVSLLVRAV